MKKFVGVLLMAAVSAMAVNISRTGPVSQYGKLKANGGHLSGSCAAYSDKNVQVKGMSLFWSNGAQLSTTFYTEKGINLMVKEMNIEVVRFAMGVDSEKFEDQGRSYLASDHGKILQEAYLDNVIRAAIDNDIYIIIDWHMESANGKTSQAAKFFGEMAKMYGQYNNVIFEVWNEPVGADMGTVASHANSVIKAIRDAGSDNLVLVGSPEWSSHPEQCAAASISDPAKNWGCTLHFYAATHQVGNGGYNSRAEEAIGKGVPVFATEWGTVSADGNGGANESASSDWIKWMNSNGVSWANWSGSAQDEGSAAFATEAINNGKLTYTQSGSMVKGWMNQNASYTDCNLKNGDAVKVVGGNFTYSTGVAAGAKTDIIDDFEDGDTYSYLGGQWSAYTDAFEKGDNGVGKSSMKNAKFTDDTGKEKYNPVVRDPDGKSKYLAGMEGVRISAGDYEYSPYITLSLNMTKDSAKFDLSKCKSISYKYKGASHNFRIETARVTNYNFHHINKDNSKDWREVEISFRQYTQESWGDDNEHFSIETGLNDAKRLAWEIAGKEKMFGQDDANQPMYDYLYIDDVRCNGLDFTAVASDPLTPSVGTGGDKSSSSNGGSAPSSSSSVGPVVVTGVVIDDVEDGDHILESGGVWYAYNDGAEGGKSSITNIYIDTLPGYAVNFTSADDPSNGSKGFVGLKGIKWSQGTYLYDPFVALGTTLMADTTLGLDMSACTGISYRYKGAGHYIKVQDGQVKDFAYHQKHLDDAAEWTTVTLPWNKIKQPTWTEEQFELNLASIKKMSWEVVGSKGMDIQPNFDFLYVDDVKCMTGDAAIAKVASRSGLNVAIH
ncbi:MAG: cellulase family glycosylhydrolase, partial [Fibrobacter sp.]|nr:cellulase family glycosylhydrolase [Fibrobacter sp.]